ncbi:MAG TPA: DUF2141 domain-containing protein [Treponemataceae bacterium]|nr:DUF2141 domain-containing protein [Treponemataceae bacterium]
MKKFLCVLLLVLGTTVAFALEVEASIVISNVQPKTGTLFVVIYNSAESMKKKQSFKTLKLETKSETITANVTLPAGEYFLSAYQDINNNGKFDTNFLGFPKEPIGIANFSGKTMPGGFDKHKVFINAENLEVLIAMITI